MKRNSITRRAVGTPRRSARFTALVVFTILFAVFSTRSAGAQFNPPPGAEDPPLFLSPHNLGRGASVTSLDSPRADAVNPAAAGGAERAVLDLSYTGITGFGRDGQGWDGHGVSLGGTLPTRYGSFTGGLSFLTAALPDYNLGTTVGTKFSYARDVWDDLSVGAGVNLDFGGTNDRLALGATLDLGMLYAPPRLLGIDNARLGAAFRGIGYGFRPFEDRSSQPSTFTPVVGLAIPLVDTDDVTLELSSDISAPTFQDGRLDIGTTLSLFDRVDINAGWGASARELIEQDRPRGSLLPSFGISVNFGADLRGRTAEDSLIARQGWDRSEVRTRLAARPLYGSAWAIGSGVNIPLGVTDETPPDVRIDYPEHLYIGPNNSGVNDDLTLPVSITDDRLITGYELRIENDDGEVVRTIQNRTEPPTERNINTFFERLTRVDTGIDVPESIRWNGRSDSGRVVPDGLYRFTLYAWDDNGNEGRSQTHEVSVDTTPPNARITTPFGAERIFSPNDDGTRDRFPIEQEGSEEIEWVGRIVSSEGETVRTWRWTNGSPEPVAWDGQTDDGEFADDGVYSYVLESTDRAGNEFSGRLANIILDTEPTPLGISIDRRYLAPTGNGVNDTITFELDVPVRRNIVSWELTVVDSDGVDVFSRSGGSDGPPERYEFRGRRADGARIAEGDYRARLSMLYRNGNEPVATSAPFTVDVTPPQAVVSGEVSVFAPTGDGNRDVMVLYNEASGGIEWYGRIIDDSGNTIREIEWSGVAPARFEWDGTRSDGSLAPDGTYEYVLEGVDAAGNRGGSEPVSFRMNTQDTDVLVTAEYSAFSPNGNGVRDTIDLFPQLRTTDGVEGYRVIVVDDNDEAVRTFSGSTVPSSLTWDGIDRDGRRASDGRYFARLEVDYETGVTADATTADFRIDTVAPEATISIDERLFSPDGADGRPSVTITQEGDDDIVWTGTVLNEAGEAVRTVRWSDGLEPFIWDGRDDAGNVVRDGRYTYELSGADEAGNSTSKEIDEITVDTRAPRIFLTVEDSGFSPTGTGRHEDIGLELLITPADGADRWTLTIHNENGSAVRTFESEDVRNETAIRWDGLDDRGDLVEQGDYRAELLVEYAKGNRPTTRSPQFEVVTRAPAVSVDLDHRPFTPDGISGPEELEFQIDVDTIASIQSWELEILDRNERFFNEFYGTGRPASVIRWDGRAADGELVISAEDYPYRLHVVDVYGNETSVEGHVPIGILLVRDGDRYKVQIPSITFEPNSPRLVVDENDPRGVQNNAVLDRLVEIFTRYRQYSIVIEGHAVNLTGTEREEEEILEPLSRARAQSVKEGLMDRGLSESRISVVGRGGLDPMVPHDDLDERWRNRRVDFILER